MRETSSLALAAILAFALLQAPIACGGGSSDQTPGITGGAGVDGGIGGSGGSPGGAGGEAGGAGSGGTGGETGGAGGPGGSGEIQGPKGHLTFHFDFPEAYGEFEFRIGLTRLPATTEPVEGCGDGTHVVVTVPEGSWEVVAKSVKGYRWATSSIMSEGACETVELFADDSTSCFEAFGFKMSPSKASTSLPFQFQVTRSDRTFSEAVTEPLKTEDFPIVRSLDRPRAELMEFVLAGKLLIVPENEDDGLISFEGVSKDGGGRIGPSTYKGRCRTPGHSVTTYSY